MAGVLSSVKRRQFWEFVGSGLTPAVAGVAVGVSGNTGRRWFGDAGGVKPRVSEPKTDGPRPRLTLGERIEIQVGVGRNESI
jgi:transposase, IS30 family